MRLVLLGAPGAGKGTQADLIRREMGLAHIASGDLLRDAQSRGSELGLLAKSYMERGQLVPDETVASLILERIAEPDCDTGFILDGFPRNVDQAEVLRSALSGKNMKTDKVIYIKVSEKELLSRLSGRWICRECQAPYHEITSPPRIAGKCDKCGGVLYQRADDTVETVKKRLEVYLSQTMPLVEHYRDKGQLVEVDGEQSIQGVSEELLGVLKGYGST